MLWPRVKVSGQGKKILQGKVKGKRRGGRQKKKWKDNVKEWTVTDVATQLGQLKRG